jgi:hypothetical protein
MQSAPPPLVGFNNNVRYRGMRFHIQTEDSGCARPHIITHLFADGGRVIKSIRTDYSEYVDHPDRPALLQRMMRDQHRAMAIDLRDGHLDATIDSLRSQAPEASDELNEEPAAPRAAARKAASRRSLPPPATEREEEPAPSSRKGARKAAAEASRAEKSEPSGAEASKEARRSRPPARGRRPSRAPEALAKKGRSVTPKGRRSLVRSAAGPKPSGDSIFGTAPQESLDDVILGYVSQGKNGPDTRGRK